MTPNLPLSLASTSPRRRQLLREAGVAFELLTAPVDEDALTATYTGRLDELGEFLAREKAYAGRAALREMRRVGRVLASDTTVLLDGEHLAKPVDADDATRMLRRLRGRVHLVATGVALTTTEADDCLSATSRTRVEMRAYSDEEIAAFVATGDPMDKAGAYSIQHPDFQPVAAFHGCHLGVIGLPNCIVAALIAGAALPPEAGARSSPCRWSPLCTPPLPGPDDVSHGTGRPGDAK
ncbi:MAG: Maf family protein [Ktedonobacterales bacterium]